MPNHPAQALQLSTVLGSECGVVMLLEPPTSDVATLLSQVLCGIYPKPFAFDNGVTRKLHFSLAFVQSEMRVKAPLDLELVYTRKMMSFLLFKAQPNHILMLGLGGGSLAKFCHCHLPDTEITVAEIDPHVIAFRRHFTVPADDRRFRVLLCDGADYVTQCGTEKHDVIMMDAFDRDGFSHSVCTREFYQKARAALTPEGILVANLAGTRDERMAHLTMIQSVFGDNVLAIAVPSDGNHVALAFRDPHFQPAWEDLRKLAKTLGQRYELDFLKYAKQLEISRRWL